MECNALYAWNICIEYKKCNENQNSLNINHHKSKDCKFFDENICSIQRNKQLSHILQVTFYRKMISCSNKYSAIIRCTKGSNSKTLNSLNFLSTFQGNIKIKLLNSNLHDRSWRRDGSIYLTCPINQQKLQSLHSIEHDISWHCFWKYSFDF